MSWLSKTWKKHSGALLGSLLYPGIGTYFGREQDKEKKEQQQANELAEIQNYNQLQQQQEAKQQALNERKMSINNTRRQLINDESDLTTGNKKKSRFTLIDNNKTLG